MLTKKKKKENTLRCRHKESFCACYISILNSKRNITIYVVSMLCVVVLLFCQREALRFLFFPLVLFMLFSFTVEPQSNRNDNIASDGLEISSFSWYRVCITTFFVSVLDEYSMCVDTVRCISCVASERFEL